MYLAVLEPIILYAASVWAPAARKLLVCRQLAAVQRGFAQKIARTHKTASLHSALILAGLLPLDLRVQEAARLFEIKRGFSRHVVRDRELELPASFLKLPHPSEQIGEEFSCLEAGEKAAQLAAAAADQVIYIDGSRIEDKVGTAFYVMQGAAQKYSKKLKLGGFCTVYQAELLALAEGTGYAASGSAQKCAILSDSRSALQTVARPDTLHPQALRVKENVKKAREKGKDVSIFWVKAHAGAEGNERADQLAKDAALKSKCKPVYEECPISFVKRQLRLETLDEWNRRYVEGETASVTRIFFPNATQSYRVLRKVGVDAVLAQLFTGHGGFSEYFHSHSPESSVSSAFFYENQASLSSI
ncbi:uncharacterized protein [Battus philenor]|uniref:uncharacterized protein n=1 Tax=Battus philenor TaxID=42288 RepID=UPI0035D018B8